MKGHWDSLRPFEKRVAVGIGAFFFIVLNFLFVFPHFSDWSRVQFRMEQARIKLGVYTNAILQTNIYTPAIKVLEHEGADVAPEDQALQFANAINVQAGQSGVHLASMAPVKTSTNQNFIEKSTTVTVQAGESNLVDFLYNLGAGNSQIRVRGLSLRPELPARQQLAAQVTLVASYQKKPTAKPPASTSVPRGQLPPARPSVTPGQTPRAPAPNPNFKRS